MEKIKLRKDLAIILILIISPFAFYLHVFAPKTQTWETLFFTIDAGYFEKVRNYLWIYSYKILTILIITIWFITCKYWWRLVLLIPLLFAVYNFISFINDRYEFYEDYQFVNSLPALIIYTLLIYFLSIKAGYYSSKKNIRSKLDSEIYYLMKELSIFKKSDSLFLKRQLRILKKEKETYEKKEYLIKLIELRDKMTI
ncbi:hypothetical protein [Psychroserpens sp. SPM9]|uniref:hypothetical protein n=1 Tax=Psychroserpens sp. SPM9 TaxID=2975598 RepID=UPI0021A57041|nr:hypothetical protein [Psychroserpens sp. SPM9]MDG5491645.1 hypothetical protein [Psychroserpens sp. SPM9]